MNLAKRSEHVRQVEKISSKRSEHVYIEEFEYRSEANRFDSDFVFKNFYKNFAVHHRVIKTDRGPWSAFRLPYYDLFIEKPLMDYHEHFPDDSLTMQYCLWVTNTPIGEQTICMHL